MELNLTHEQIKAIRIIEAIGTIKIDYNCKLCLPTKDCIKCSKYKPKIVRWKCKLCGRDKFTRKSPHRCNSGFRKRHIIWEAIYNLYGNGEVK